MMDWLDGRGGNGDQLVCFVHRDSINSGHLFVHPLSHRAQDVSENLLRDEVEANFFSGGVELVMVSMGSFVALSRKFQKQRCLRASRSPRWLRPAHTHRSPQRGRVDLYFPWEERCLQTGPESAICVLFGLISL